MPMMPAVSKAEGPCSSDFSGVDGCAVGRLPGGRGVLVGLDSRVGVTGGGVMERRWSPRKVDVGVKVMVGVTDGVNVGGSRVMVGVAVGVGVVAM